MLHTSANHSDCVTIIMPMKQNSSEVIDDISVKKLQFIYTVLTATDQKPQKSYKGNVNHTNIA